VLIHDKDRKKMGEKSWTGILMGYAHEAKVTVVYDPRSGRVETSRDVRFSEEEKYYPVEPPSQGFGDESVRVVEVEPERVESEVTSERPRESVGSGQVEREEVSEQEEEPEMPVREEVQAVQRRSTRVRFAPEKLTASKPGSFIACTGTASWLWERSQPQ
jgi:hypothetical protein